MAGELLRAMTFDGEGGCYSTFDLTPGFAAVPPTVAIFEALWLRAHDARDESDTEALPLIDAYWNAETGVLVAWHWDGDGTLHFSCPAISIGVTNTDCKKDYGWEAVAPVCL